MHRGTSLCIHQRSSLPLVLTALSCSAASSASLYHDPHGLHGMIKWSEFTRKCFKNSDTITASPWTAPRLWDRRAKVPVSFSQEPVPLLLGPGPTVPITPDQLSEIQSLTEVIPRAVCRRLPALQPHPRAFSSHCLSLHLSCSTDKKPRQDSSVFPEQWS